MGQLLGQLTLDVWRLLQSGLPSDVPDAPARLVRRHYPAPRRKQEAG